MNSCFCVSYVPVLPNAIMSPKKYVLLPELDQLACSSLGRFAELGNGGKMSHVKEIDLQACFCLWLLPWILRLPMASFSTSTAPSHLKICILLIPLEVGKDFSTSLAGGRSYNVRRCTLGCSVSRKILLQPNPNVPCPSYSSQNMQSNCFLLYACSTWCILGRLFSVPLITDFPSLNLVPIICS